MNARHVLATVVLLASCATLVIGAAAPRRPSAVSMGNLSLQGGSATRSVSPEAITPGEGPELVGTLTNNTGRAMHDVTLELKRVGTSGAPPTSSGSSTLSATSGTGGSASATNSATASGFKAGIQLNGSSLGSIPNGGSVDFAVDVSGAGSADSLEFRATPSVEAMDQTHADMLQTFEPSAAAPGATHALAGPTHDRASILVKNGDGKKLRKLVGSCTLPEGVWLGSIHLCDPSSASIAVPGTSIQIDGSSFAITGFAPLDPAQAYELVVVFSTVPPELYKVSLEAEFAD